MNDQVLRLQSRQGGPFRSQLSPTLNNLVDFDIPDSDVWDLSKSWVNLYYETTVTASANAAGLDGIYNLLPRWRDNAGNNTGFSNYNVGLVKNASMVAAKAGRLEDIREVGVLRQNLMEYTMSNAERESRDYRDFNVAPDRTGYKFTQLVELQKEGTVESSYVNAQCQIPLSEIFELGKLTQYHATKWGKTRVHLELNSDRFAVTNPANYVQDNAQFAFDDVTTTGDFDTLLTTSVYQRLEDSPFWVGQILRITATATAPSGTFPDLANAAAKITAIEWLRTSGKMQLTIEWNATTGTPVIPAGEEYNTISWAALNPASAFASCTQAEIVLTRVREPEPAPDVLAYKTWTTEQFSGNGEQNFQRMFQLEPEAVNVLLMFPVNSLISQNNNLSQYRLRLNNEDLIDRPVNIVNAADGYHDPLHYDRINMTLLNCGMEMKNFTQDNLNNNSLTLASMITNGQRLLLIGNPVPMTDREKNLQVNLVLGGTGLLDMNLYKQVQRTIQ